MRSVISRPIRSTTTGKRTSTCPAARSGKTFEAGETTPEEIASRIGTPRLTRCEIEFPLRNPTVDLLLTIGIRSRCQPGNSPQGQVRRSASARLGQVQGGSHRMRPPKFLPTGHGGGAHARPRFHPARPVSGTRCRRGGRACRSSPRRAQRRRPPAARRCPARTLAAQHRLRHPPVYRGGRARRGGHCGVCLLRARPRGGPGPRRGRDHRPARAATIDGLVYASSMVVLYAARHRVPVPSLARWLLALGIAATLTANMAQGWAHGLVGAVIAAWPAVSLVGSYELLVWLIRTCGAADRVPLAGHLCTGAAAYCAAARPVPVPAAGGERPGGSERGTSDLAWRPAGQAAGPSPAPPAGRRVRPALSMTRRWPRTGLACRPATRCRNAVSRRCSGAHRAAGRGPGSPMHGRHRRSQTRRAPRSRHTRKQGRSGVCPECGCDRVGWIRNPGPVGRRMRALCEPGCHEGGVSAVVRNSRPVPGRRPGS